MGGNCKSQRRFKELQEDNRATQIHLSGFNAQRRLNIAQRILPYLNPSQITTKEGCKMLGRQRNILSHFIRAGQEALQLAQYGKWRVR